MPNTKYSRMRKVGEPMTRPSISSKEFYGPSISFTDKELPDQKDWDPGETYCLEIEVKMTHRSEGAGSYQIQKVGAESADEYEED